MKFNTNTQVLLDSVKNEGAAALVEVGLAKTANLVDSWSVVPEGLDTNLSDADATFSAIMLTSLDKTDYAQVYAGMSAEKVFPAKTDIDIGLTIYQYEETDVNGRATRSNDLGEISTFPMAEFKRNPKTHPLVYIQSGFSLKISELQSAAVSGYPIDRTKQVGSERIIARDINTICWEGDDALGIDSFPSQVTKTANLAVKLDDATKTGDEKYDAIVAQIAEYNAYVATAFTINKILVSPAVHTILTSMKVGTDASKTIAKMLVENGHIPNLEALVSCPELTTPNQMFIGDFNLLTVARLAPQPTTYLPPQLSGAVQKFPGYAKTGGVVVRYPDAFRKITSVLS